MQYLASESHNAGKESPAPVSLGLLRRKCACGNDAMGGGCGQCSKEGTLLRRQARDGSQSAAVPPIVHDVLSSPGYSLDQRTRSFFEQRLGYDFSQVRVHTGSRAAESARAVRASAYTVGHDIVLGSDKSTAGTAEGRRLLAHELTHVIQQGAHNTPSASSGLAIGPADDSHEHEAVRAEETITRHSASGTTGRVSRPRLQRSPYDVLKPGQPKPLDIKVTPTSRLIPFSEIDFREPPNPRAPITPSKTSPLPRPEGPEPPPKATAPTVAPEPDKPDKKEAGEGPEVKSTIQGSMSDKEITTVLEVGIPIKSAGPFYVFGQPVVLNKELTMELKAGPPKPPFGLPPPLSQLGVNLSLKALSLEFEPIKRLLPRMKEFQVAVSGEAGIDPLSPFRPELGVKTEVSAEYQLGNSPVSLFGKVGYKVTFPPGGNAEAAPIWDFGFKVLLPQFGKKPESRK